MEPSGLSQPAPTKRQEWRSLAMLGVTVVFLISLILLLGGPPHAGTNQPLHAKVGHAQKAWSHAGTGGTDSSTDSASRMAVPKSGSPGEASTNNLRDRRGTPLRSSVSYDGVFQALSAGPDRVFGTSDDIVD